MRQDDWAGYARSALRVVAGLLFMLHGLQKVSGMFGGINGHGASPPVGSEFWVAGVLEAVGGVAIVLGLFTRPVAFLLCGEMAVAYFRAHFPHAFWPIQNGGELAVLYCFIFLYLFAAGPGPFSLDRVLRRT
ncbi:MAG TPA: DoxX family protein [Candidatus Solibacter sp.]|nr:DoxX family protein [Candidatus Solibacter sp.]